jgi:exosortase A-associated hydrolase 1
MNGNVRELAISFDCQGDNLAGVLHRPEQPVGIGMLIVVGGPQYRVGSHRHFVLLARYLAQRGVPVLRFDCRGYGDSEGQRRDFLEIESDIFSAIGALAEACPSIKGIVTWGLCDAATACALCAERSPVPVVGQIALNPWVRTEAGEAKTLLRQHYLRRLLDRRFWGRLLRGDVAMRSAIGDVARKILSAAASRQDSAASDGGLPSRLARAQMDYPGRTLLVLSGNDFVSQEYESSVKKNPEWRAWMTSRQVDLVRLEDADHTFSSRTWRDTVNQACAGWLLEVASSLSVAAAR